MIRGIWGLLLCLTPELYAYHWFTMFLPPWGSLGNLQLEPLIVGTEQPGGAGLARLARLGEVM